VHQSHVVDVPRVEHDVAAVRDHRLEAFSWGVQVVPVIVDSSCLAA
jgi:hypothetical protein